MLAFLITASAVVALAGAFLFYFNYVAHFRRVQVYGKRRKINMDAGIIPVFDLPDLLIDPDELRLLALVKMRKLPVAVCLGDSITHGIVSENYVARLQDEFQGRCVFVNSGVNGNLAYNLNARMREDCLEYDPDYVTVLIGTNDVNALSGGRTLRNYQRFQRLPALPDKAFFLTNLRAVFESLRGGTRARVAVLSLPVIGEHLDSTANRAVREYSMEIKAMAEEFGFAYLPLNESQNAFIASHGGKKPAKALSRMALVHILLMLRRSFDRIAEIHGRVLTYDGLHQTSAGAQMIVGLIQEWLNAEMAADSPSGRPAER
jgi:lysophospholipase L1-like esterase